jgi:hypothetical protein
MPISSSQATSEPYHLIPPRLSHIGIGWNGIHTFGVLKPVSLLFQRII